MTPTQDTPATAYLRDRPFLLIQFFKVPARPDGAKRTLTERKGWMNEPRNVAIKEYPLIVDRVSAKQLNYSGIVIDVIRDTVIKKSTTEPDSDILARYSTKYADIIERGRAVWLSRTVRHTRDQAA